MLEKQRHGFFNQFSEREKEVINLLLQGKSNKQIAVALGVTSHTSRIPPQ